MRYCNRSGGQALQSHCKRRNWRCEGKFIWKRIMNVIGQMRIVVEVGRDGGRLRSKSCKKTCLLVKHTAAWRTWKLGIYIYQQNVDVLHEHTADKSDKSPWAQYEIAHCNLIHYAHRAECAYLRAHTDRGKNSPPRPRHYHWDPGPACGERYLHTTHDRHTSQAEERWRADWLCEKVAADHFPLILASHCILLKVESCHAELLPF